MHEDMLSAAILKRISSALHAEVICRRG